MEILRIENLRFAYEPSQWILDNINLRFRKGEFVLLIGPSGCGKTTLLYCINGLIPHRLKRGIRKGKVLLNINGKWHDVASLPMNVISQHVQTVFQDPEIQFFKLHVIDELAFTLENLGYSREEIARRIEFAAKACGIEHLLNKDVFSLSGGEKQRVAIASALAVQPDILLLDEPTSNLDPVGAKMVLETIERIAKHGSLVILVEHRLEETSKHADRVIVMHEGRILVDAPPKKVYGDPELLQKLYEIGIRPPWPAELISRLKKKRILPENAPVPLTVEDASNIIKEYLKQGQLIPIKIPTPDIPSMFSSVDNNRRPVIEIKNLWYMYPDGTVALRGINLKIYEGEFVGIIGNNGSGKSTLLLNILGLLRPSYGKVYVFGKDVTKISVAELARHVGLVLQNPDLMLFQPTVWKELAFGPRNLGLPREEIERRVKMALKMMKIERFAQRDPHRLSRGQRHRVAVGAVLSMIPKIFIADEPTTGQDYGSCKDYLELLAKLNKEGRTIIVVSHTLDIIARYCSRVVVLHRGRIVLDGPPREVFARADILEQIQLDIPYITRISLLLRDLGIPVALRIEELEAYLEKMSRAKVM